MDLLQITDMEKLEDRERAEWMQELTDHTVVDWCQFMRDECSWKMLNDPVVA